MAKQKYEKEASALNTNLKRVGLNLLGTTLLSAITYTITWLMFMYITWSGYGYFEVLTSHDADGWIVRGALSVLNIVYYYLQSKSDTWSEFYGR